MSDLKCSPEEFRHYAPISSPTRVGYFLPHKCFKKEIDATLNRLKSLKRINPASLTSLEGSMCFPDHSRGSDIRKLSDQKDRVLKQLMGHALGFQDETHRQIVDPFNPPPRDHLEQGKVQVSLEDCLEQFDKQLQIRRLFNKSFGIRD